MNKYLLAVFFLAISSFAQSQNIEGKYNCAGIDIEKQAAFKCELSLTKTVQTYAGEVNCNDGTTYTSTGIYNPEKNSISLVSVNPKDPKETGVAVVTVNKNGSLNSVWTYLGKTTVGHTHCMRRR